MIIIDDNSYSYNCSYSDNYSYNTSQPRPHGGRAEGRGDREEGRLIDLKQTTTTTTNGDDNNNNKDNNSISVITDLRKSQILSYNYNNATTASIMINTIIIASVLYYNISHNNYLYHYKV